MNPSYNHAKGKKFERKVAELLTQISGVKYRRVPSSGALHGFLDFDLMKEEKKDSIFDDIGNECKDHKVLKVPDWINQIEVACEDAHMQFNPKWFVAFNYKGKIYFIINKNLFSELFTIKKQLEKLSTDEVARNNKV